MLDIHVLIGERTNPCWLAQCLASIRQAQARAGFPTALWLIPAIDGHIGAGRTLGYAYGTYPYVTYVDDDDYLLPDALHALGPSMRAGYDGIFPRELHWRDGKLHKGIGRHHLTTYRREHLIDHLSWPACGDIAQVSAMLGKRVIDLPEALYVHRQYQGSGAARLRMYDSHELIRARLYSPRSMSFEVDNAQIDVHVLIENSTKQALVDACLDSVHEAIRRSPIPVSFHLLQAIDGHVGEARQRGYARGKAPYVTYVDDDDLLLPDAFVHLAKALERRPEAIFPREMVEMGSRRRPGMQRHHLVTFLREYIIDHTAWHVCGDLAQMQALREGDIIEIPECLYVHRVYPQSGGMQLRRRYPDEQPRSLAYPLVTGQRSTSGDAL